MAESASNDGNTQQSDTYWVGSVGFGPGKAVTGKQDRLGLGAGTGFEPQIGNLDHSTWKQPEFKGNMPRYAVLGWKSVDEQGRMPPGMRNFGKLPPGVTPGIAPSDRERMRFCGAVHTVAAGDHPPNSNYLGRFWENFMTMKQYSLLWIPQYILAARNKLSLFDTEPRYHLRLPPVTPIWDCHVNDVWCTAHADKRAMVERRVDHNIVKIIAQRLETCHKAAVGDEHKFTAKQFAHEYFCGDLDETLKEVEGAYELKWGRLPYRKIEYQLGKLAYMKQKNRYIEDRFRYRMMKNVGAAPNYDAFEAAQENPRIVDGPDRWVHHDRRWRNHEYWPEHIWRRTLGGIFNPTEFDHRNARPTWSMDEALQVEAAKRAKMRAAAEEE